MSQTVQQTVPIKLFRVFLWLTPFPVSLLLTLPAILWLAGQGSPLFWPAFFLIPFTVCLGIGLLLGLLDLNTTKEEGKPLMRGWIEDAMVFALSQLICFPVLGYLLLLVTTMFEP